MRHRVSTGIATCILLASCSPGERDREAPAPPSSHHRGPGFALEVPTGWVPRDTSYWFDEFNGVFLVVRNARAGKATPHDFEFRNGKYLTIRFDAESFRREIPDGAAIVVFAHLEGGPPSDWIWEYQADTVGERLPRSLRASTAGWKKDHGLEILRLGFTKWHDRWCIMAFGTDPLSREDRRAIESMIASLEFPALPVVLREQALRLAFAHLPPEVRASCLPGVPWPEHPSRTFTKCGEVRRGPDVYDVRLGTGAELRRTVAAEVDSSFDIRFQLGDEGDGRRPQVWAFSVSRDGNVLPRESR